MPAGCGPNCAFVTLPVRLGLRPLLTGWLADPSVLGPGADAPQLGAQVRHCPVLALCCQMAVHLTLHSYPCPSIPAAFNVQAQKAQRPNKTHHSPPLVLAQVNYSEEVALLGGTPSFALPLLTFNHLMALWRELGVDSDNTGAPIALPALHAYVVGLQARGAVLSVMLPPVLHASS